MIRDGDVLTLGGDVLTSGGDILTKMRMFWLTTHVQTRSFCASLFALPDGSIRPKRDL